MHAERELHMAEATGLDGIQHQQVIPSNQSDSVSQDRRAVPSLLARHQQQLQRHQGTQFDNCQQLLTDGTIGLRSWNGGEYNWLW